MKGAVGNEPWREGDLVNGSAVSPAFLTQRKQEWDREKAEARACDGSSGFTNAVDSVTLKLLLPCFSRALINLFISTSV